MGVLDGNRGLNLKVGCKLDEQAFKNLENKANKIVTKISQTASGKLNITKTITSANGSITTLTKTVDRYNQKAEYTVKSHKSIKQETDKTSSSTKSFTAQMQKANAQAVNMANSILSSSKKVQTLGDKLWDAVKKVALFGGATKIIGAFRDACSKAVEEVKKIDDALTEFKKVSDLSGSGLNEYINQLADAGQKTASTIDAMINASTEFRKSGFSDEESAILAQTAEMFRNIADNELTAGESANFIISQIKAFNFEAEDSMHIINAVNEVANNFAVSSADLSDNLGKVSATLATNGVAFEEQLGMITAITEVTRNASTASRGLRTISSRLVQVLDESSSTGKKLTKIYEDLGIALYDDEGQLRSTYDILQDLSKQWGNLDKNQRDYIALTSSGANQVQNFTALMTNFGQAVKATATAYSSAGSAEKENEKYMESLTAKLQVLESEFQKLVWGEGGLNNFLKTLVDAGTKILKFANSDVGQTIIKLTALLASTSLLSKSIKAINFSSVVSGLDALRTNLELSKAGLGALTTKINDFVFGLKVTGLALWDVVKAWLATPFGIATVAIGGIAGIIAIVKAFNVTLEEHLENLNELQSEYSNIQSDLEEAQNKLKSVNDAIKEIQSKGKLEITDKDQLILLESERDALESEIALLREKERIQKGEIREEAQGTLESEVSYFTFADNKNTANYTTGIGKGTTTEGLQSTLKSLDDVRQSIRETEAEIKKMNVTGSASFDTTAYQNLNNKLSNLRDLYKTLRDQATDFTSTLIEVRKALDESNPLDAPIISLIDSLTNSYGLMTTATTEYGDVIVDTGEDLEEFADDTEEAEEKLGTLKDVATKVGASVKDFDSALKLAGMGFNELANYAEHGYSSVEEFAQAIYDSYNVLTDWNNAVDNIQSSFESMQSVMDEYNSSGILTVDTMQKLMAVNTDYIGTLQIVNGQIQLNEQYYRDLIEAKKTEAKETVMQNTVETVYAITMDTVRQTEQEAGDASVTARQQIHDFIQKGEEGIGTFSGFAVAVTKSAIAMGANGDALKRNEGKINDAIQAGWDLINLIDSVDTSYTKSAKTATSSAKKQSDAFSSMKSSMKATLDANINAIDKELDAIKRAKDAEIKAIDKKISALQKEKDAQVKAVEKQIKALEKERDAIQKQYEAEIKSLEKQREQVEKYWNDRIEQYKRANEEIERNIELQQYQEALARANATQVKVFDQGRFTYQSDEGAVSEAQQALDDYQRQIAQEEYLQALEDARDRELAIIDERIEKLQEELDAKMEYYDSQIEMLEEYRDYLEEYYDEQIEALEEYKDQVQENYDAQIENLENLKEEIQNKYDEIIAQMEQFSANAVGQYGTILADAEAFVSRYNAIMSDMSFAGGGGSGITISTNGAVGGLSTGIASFANGISSYGAGGRVADNGLAVVGEDPNKEIVIGKSLNSNGTLMRLKRGSGVVNAKSTNTLAGILNNLGELKGIGSLKQGSNSGVTQCFNFDNITLPNVTDANSFVTELSRNFNNYAIQYANLR